MNWISEFGLSTLAYAGSFLGVLIAFEGDLADPDQSETTWRGDKPPDADDRSAVPSTEERLRLLKPDDPNWALARLPLSAPAERSPPGRHDPVGERSVLQSGRASIVLGLAICLVVICRARGLCDCPRLTISSSRSCLSGWKDAAV